MRLFNCDCYYEDMEENHCSCSVTHSEGTKSYFERNNICGYYDPVEVVKNKKESNNSNNT